jgi:two-component system sensor histidine kinase/response regulator
VIAAADGVETVDRFSDGGFDLILMDTQMPQLNGLEATSAIRNRESKDAHIPIIAMTANVMKGFREECLNAGMDGYVTKPLRREVLVEEMARVIPNLIVTDAPPPGPIEMKAPQSAASSEFDEEAFLASVGGSRETLREVLGITLSEDVPRLRQALDDAESSGDPAQLEQAAHAIKGLAAELRAEPCRAAAAALEKSRSVQEVAPLRHEFQKLVEALGRIAKAGG